MKIVRGYSDLASSVSEELKMGIVADTNVLISASYDLDSSNDVTIRFFDELIAYEIPLFCNVNVKAEFLEIHRRIIFTEALLDFEAAADKSKLPVTLVRKLNSIRSRAAKKTNQGGPPLRLQEGEIKGFKSEMCQVKSASKDLWTALCEDRVGNKLSSVWSEVESELGLNFLSYRKEDKGEYFHRKPVWNDAMGLMESHGLSSSDAMILNIFLCSKFSAIATSDWEVASAVFRIQPPNKIVFSPDEIATRIG